MLGADAGLTDGRAGPAAAFTAIDLGAGKISCLIAAMQASPGVDHPIDIVGAGHVAIRRGVGGPDPEAHARLVGVALDQARRMSGDEVTPTGVVYSGTDLASTVATGRIRLRRGQVGVAEVAAAIGDASRTLQERGLRVLHAAPLSYSIDDGDAVSDPRGLAGAQLAAEVCLVHAPEASVAALEETLQKAGAAPAMVAAAPFAAGFGVLSAEEMDRGAIVLDLGEQGAGIAVFRDGGLIHAEILSGCGARLSNDLAARLNTTFAVAERAKLLHGGLVGDHDPSEALEIPVIGEDGRLQPGLALRAAFEEALRPRLEEIFARIAGRLAALGARGEGLGVALAGGVSAMPGLRSIAQQSLKRPARIAILKGFAGLEDQAGGLAACAGLLRCGLERYAAPAQVRRRPSSPQETPAPLRRRVGEAVAWIKENF